VYHRAIFVHVSDIRPAAIRTGKNDDQSCCISRGKKNFWPSVKTMQQKFIAALFFSYALSNVHIIEQ